MLEAALTSSCLYHRLVSHSNPPPLSCLYHYLSPICCFWQILVTHSFFFFFFLLIFICGSSPFHLIYSSAWSGPAHFADIWLSKRNCSKWLNLTWYWCEDKNCSLLHFSHLHYLYFSTSPVCAVIITWYRAEVCVTLKCVLHSVPGEMAEYLYGVLIFSCIKVN